MIEPRFLLNRSPRCGSISIHKNALVAKWQTRKLEVLVGNTVEVRVLSSAFNPP